MSLFSFLTRTQQPALGDSRCNLRRPDYRPLEARRMLAANIYYDAATLTVTVIGDDTANTLYVTETQSGNLDVNVVDGPNASFLPGEVTEVQFYALGGNDAFYNQSSIPARFGAGAGDDIFVGGSGDDWSFADSGNDQLSGGGGNDFLNGGDDNDTVDGGDGDDALHGGDGDDVVNGGEGADSLWGGFGDDVMDGGAGADALYGFSGADDLDGGDGDDQVYGQAHDDIVRGGNGADRVRGNNGNDTLYGGAGDDYMMFDDGDDTGYGEDGNDTMLPHFGNDFAYGGAGSDYVVARGGTNHLYGGDDDDRIIGGEGTDFIYGQAGEDSLFGRAGNDQIFGGAGADRLHGEAGDDLLFGGESASGDSLTGGGDDDRVVVQENDNLTDAGARDAVLEFIDHTSNWNDTEIMVLVEAINQMYDVVGNNLLLQETLNDDSLRLIKYADLDGAAGLNYLETSTSWYWQNGQQIFSYSYYREIRILDWDENSTFYNDQFVEVFIHELAHNWDSETELVSVSSQLQTHWNSFLSLSGWTESDPSSSQYTQSLDGQWWYLNSAGFAESYGRSNPYEDMATVFEFYFANGTTASNNVLASKLNLVDSIFAELALI